VNPSELDPMSSRDEPPTEVQLLRRRMERERSGRLEAEAIAERALRELYDKNAALVKEMEERQKLEAQYRQSQKMEAMGVLAGGVAHDFNNLLTVISGYSEVLQTRLPPQSPLQELVGHIAQAGERAALLTRQLLAFSRKQLLESRVLCLNLVVQDIAKMLRRLIGADFELRLLLDSRIGALRADPGQLGQVLLNLAINARDAMPRGGVLTIRTANVEAHEHHRSGLLAARRGQYLLLEVEDTGCGMDDATRARIFEPFFTTKEAGKGTGLGLSTVYGIVTQSDGLIEVASDPGRGAAFRLYFPVVGEPSTARRCTEGVPELGGEETVLLVEDEAAVRELARSALEARGYCMLEARNGEEALRLAQEHGGEIHLLVTDLVMPGMGGCQLAERLQTGRRAIRVLYVSGYAGDVMLRHGGSHREAAVLLQKPFTPRELLMRVREVLDA
jgi:two-component system, cell cycle sensor histidine kinase and response regulator CckA